jgi:NADPH-dependent 2,4-dienoyl-CoA reductase/sulfur reductase-like enzyme
MTRTVDVAVVGAGPAGIAAAVAAREAGASVAVIDRYPAIGGQIWKRPLGEPPAPDEARGWATRLEASGAEMLLDTAVWGVRDGHTLLTERADGTPGAVRAAAIVLATGAHDRPVAFPGWTLPGVMTAGAAQTLVKAQRTLPGRRVLLAGAGPFLLPVAAALEAAGAEVVAVAEATRRRRWAGAGPRMLRHPRHLAEYAAYRARLSAVPFLWGHVLVRADGPGRVERATLARADAAWRPVPGSERTFEVDALCTAYGFLPALELGRALGCELDGDALAHDAAMRTSVSHVFVAGEAAGIGGAELALTEGAVAGRRAAGADVPAGLGRRRRRAAHFAGVLDDLFRPGPGLAELPDPDTVLCRCEDVTAAAVDRAVADGADSLTALKLATRCGQGPCQGRMCERTVAARVPSTGRFSSRAPVRPVTVATLIDDVTASRS